MDISLVCKDVIKACRIAGDFILENKYRVSADDIEHKSLNSLVSYVDKGAEQRLVNSLKKIIPEAGFITEEGTVTERGETYNWVIDPLDGTTNFLHGLPVYAVSVGLMQNSEVVAGVILELGRNECFYAWKGGGAYLNGEPIHVSENKSLSDSLLATGFPYHDFDRMQGFLALLSEFFKSTRGVRRLGSAATDLAYVACGRFDGFFEYGLSPWDVAAGVIIVQEAGGIVKDYRNGNDYIFGQEIAAGNPRIFKDFLKTIREYMAEGGD